MGLVDCRRLSEKLNRFDGQIIELGDQRDASVAEAEAAEAQLLESETRATEIHDGIRAAESRIGANRERIAGHESTIEHQLIRCRDLEEELAQHRKQVAAMSLKAGDLVVQLRSTRREVEEAEEQHRQVALQFAEGDKTLLVAGLAAGIEFWDVAERTLRFRLPAHRHHGIRDIALSSDGRVIATASNDDTVRLWRRASVEQARAAGW